ncbi:MAG: hypothetical protein ACE5KE_04305 [Methanosarcinales archaeon]
MELNTLLIILGLVVVGFVVYYLLSGKKKPEAPKPPEPPASPGAPTM